MKHSTAGLYSKGLRCEFGAVDVEDGLNVVLLRYSSKSAVVAPGNELLDLLDLGFGEKGAGELKELENFGTTGDFNGQFALSVGNGIVDFFLLEEELNNRGATLNCSKVQRSVAILVAGIHINGAKAIGQYVLDDGELGALNRQMQDCGVLEGVARCADGGDVSSGAILSGISNRSGDGGCVAAFEGLDDSELADGLLESDGLVYCTSGGGLRGMLGQGKGSR